MWSMRSLERERHQEKKEYALAEARTVQCMKATHQFSLDGSWRVAWPLTYLPDPIERAKMGATEPELEAVLGWLRVHDDIKRKTKATTNLKDIVSSDDENQEEASGNIPKKKNKKKYGGAAEQADGGA